MINLENLIENVYERKIAPKVKEALENLEKLRANLPKKDYYIREESVFRNLARYIKNILRSGILAYKKAHFKRVDSQIKSLNKKIKYATVGAIASLISTYIVPLMHNLMLTALSFASFLGFSLLCCYLLIKGVPLAEERRYLRDIDEFFIDNHIKRVFYRISKEYGLFLDNSNN